MNRIHNNHLLLVLILFCNLYIHKKKRHESVGIVSFFAKLHFGHVIIDSKIKFGIIVLLLNNFLSSSEKKIIQKLLKVCNQYPL